MLDDQALVAAGPRGEIEDEQVKNLREHHGDDHEGHTRGAQREQADDQSEQGAAGDAGDEGFRHVPAEMIDGEPCAIESGGEEHGVTEAEQADIAEKQIVAHGQDGQRHDAGKQPLMIVRQDEVQHEQKRDDADMQRIGFCRRSIPHRAVVPNSP